MGALVRRCLGLVGVNVGCVAGSGDPSNEADRPEHATEQG